MLCLKPEPGDNCIVIGDVLVDEFDRHLPPQA